MKKKTEEQNKKTLDKGISVIIPVYNSAQYLQQFFDSLFSQTFKNNLEFIFVIDKNSSDKSAAFVEKTIKYMPNSRIIKPKKGSGTGYNRNMALKYVTKDYVGFCDSDDWMDSDFYERLYDYAQIYNADVAIGNTLLVDDRTKNVFNKAEFPFSVEYITGKIFTMLKWNTVWDKIYRTELLKNNNNIRFSEGTMHENNIFLINAVYYANKVITVPGSYYYWRRYPGSGNAVSEHDEKFIQDALIEFNKILDTLSLMNMTKYEKSIIIHQVMPWAKHALMINTEINNRLRYKIKDITGEDFKF